MPLRNDSILHRWLSRPPTIVCTLLLISSLHNASIALLLQPKIQRIPLVFSRKYQTFCRQSSTGAQQQQQQRGKCWEFSRLSLHQSSTTRLYGSTEQEVETAPTTINGDSHDESTVNGAIVNGASAGANVNGAALHNTNNEHGTTITTPGASLEVTSNHDAATPPLPQPISYFIEMDENDVPKPTPKGGFSHTLASKAKIAAANRGNTPWNKGKPRSEAVKARIAAGVHARNRERFLLKLDGLGLTEEEYEAQTKQAKDKEEAERLARRTPKGGYRPTEETKAKISRILKEKHLKGEIKPRTIDPTKVRRGFTHTEETRKKISESLKQRWANDPDYRERMKQQARRANTEDDVRERISQSLKKKWQDPEFRTQMMAKMSTRRSTYEYDSAHREKISKAMKAKWQDAEYREKTLKSIAKRQATSARDRPIRAATPKKARAKKYQVKGTAKNNESVTMIEPRTQPDPVSPKKKKKKVTRKKSIRFVEKDEDDEPAAVALQPNSKAKKKAVGRKKKEPKVKKEPDGSVNRLKEERRDLFDLLYGDDNVDSNADADDDADEQDESQRPKSASFGARGDEDLDSFDPYGLEDDDDEDLDSFDPYGLDDY
jgi:hypothetical protein